MNPRSKNRTAGALRLVHLAALQITHPVPVPGGLLRAWFRHYLIDRRRNHVDRRRAADCLVGDARRHKPDDWLLIGPLTCLGQPIEYHQARHWLETIAPADHVAIVPGGNDLNPHANWSHTLQQWSPWICSDHGRGAAEPFPYWRQRGHAALIGLPPKPAAEPVTRGRQLQRLEELLQRASQAGLFRIVLCQNAPCTLRGADSPPARDHDEWTSTLLAGGVELLLYSEGADWHLCTFNTASGGALALQNAAYRPAAGGGILGFYSVLSVSRDESGFRLEIERYRLAMPAVYAYAEQTEIDLSPAERLDQAVFILSRPVNPG